MTDDAKQEPEAMRYGFDGFGYRYIDSGSGSDWRTRHPDAEPLYAQPQTDALAILTAIREPSEAMKEKGFAAYYDTQIPQHPIIAAFTAMIDEAFEEQSK